MARNFLKGTVGNAINALMAAAAFNFKKLMRLGGIYWTIVFFRLWAHLAAKTIAQYRLIPASSKTF